MAGSWNDMICKFLSNPNHSGIKGLFGFLNWNLLQMEDNPRKDGKWVGRGLYYFCVSPSIIAHQGCGKGPGTSVEQREMGLLSNSLHTLVCTTANWDFLEIQPYFSNPASNLLNFPYVQRTNARAAGFGSCLISSTAQGISSLLCLTPASPLQCRELWPLGPVFLH